MTGFSPDHADAIVRPSPNFGPRLNGSRPEILLLHYTGMATGLAAEDRLCAAESQVSSHYLVRTDGRIVQMVREADRAWHAGKSCWRGVTDINSQSIGIEIVNPGHGLGYPGFPKRQIASVVTLCAGVVRRHAIEPRMVLGHSDVAPGRKVDPGEKFPWRLLFRAGIGLWVPPARTQKGVTLRPGDSGEAIRNLQELLGRYGYGLAINGVFEAETAAVVYAFQQHFRQLRVDGIADPATVETLRRLLAALPSGSAPSSLL